MVLKIKNITFLICCVWLLKGKAQVLNPVSWAYGAKRVDAAEAVLMIKATIQPGWHIYSIYQKEGGPSKTVLKFIKSNEYSELGKISEPAPIRNSKKHLASW